LIEQFLLKTEIDFDVSGKHKVIERNQRILIFLIMSEYIKPESTEKRKKDEYLEAGADYVITSLADLKDIINMINSRLTFREKPEN
jgi:hypothetical protein